MRLLLTNDDGVVACGLITLYKELSKNHSVTVVAPDREHSGGSHAITLSRPIPIQRLSTNGGPTGWAVGGTPADCVKLAYWELMTDCKPDLVVSGINRGANTGLNLLYSGTVGAAREAALLGMPSIAFSLDSHSPEADFRPAAAMACRLVDLMLECKLNTGSTLNVNFPESNILDMDMCRLTTQSLSVPKEGFIARQDPRGNTYYWQDQESYTDNGKELTDRNVLESGLISITPVRLDLTSEGDFSGLTDRFGK